MFTVYKNGHFEYVLGECSRILLGALIGYFIYNFPESQNKSILEHSLLGYIRRYYKIKTTHYRTGDLTEL